MDEFDDHADVDAEPQASEAEADLRIQGGLLDPSTFPPNRVVPADLVVPPQEPVLTGPLMSDAHAEVLQDVLNAQAKLWPVRPRPESWSINGQPYLAITAGNFDPARSSHVTSMPTPADSAVAFAERSKIAATGSEERAGYIARAPSRVVEVRGKAGGGDRFDTYTYHQPTDSPGIHGHIDNSSEGMVDSTEAKGGYGDTFSLQWPQPMATVYRGQVGWHVLDDGRLKFLYPPGSMTDEQIGKMQQNLDQEQRKFLRPR
jgi:hypothetical protein